MNSQWFRRRDSGMCDSWNSLFDEVLNEFNGWYLNRQRKLNNQEKRRRLHEAFIIINCWDNPKENARLFFKWIEDKKVKIPEDIKNKLLLLSL